MSIYFIANNIHFALELLGALVFLVMSWLSIDAYVVSKNRSSLMRVSGFCLVGVWQLIYAFNFSSDLANFGGFFIYILGLVLLVLSLYTAPRIAALSAVILVPSFSTTLPFLHFFAALLLAYISWLIYSQIKSEFNKSLQPLFLGFIFLTGSALVQIAVSSQTPDNFLWYVARVLETVSFVSFAFWVWQYLKLRVRESLVLIFLSMTLFIATIVTLAFSTILIGKIEQETRNNLLINAKVFDFSVQILTQQSAAEAKLVASDSAIKTYIANEDLAHLESALVSYLDQEKLGFLLATDRSGAVIMRAHSPNERGDSIVNERAIEQALIGNSFSTIEYSAGEKFSIRASSPVFENGKVIGVILAGFPLDNVMTDRIKKITGLDTTLYQGDVAIATTALGEDGRSRLTNVKFEDTDIKENVLVKGQNATSRVVIKNIPFLASYLPITDGDNKIVGMFSAAKPQADIIDIANATNRLTLVTVTALLLLLAIPLYKMTRYLIEGL